MLVSRLSNFQFDSRVLSALPEVNLNRLELYPVRTADVTYYTVVHQIAQRFFVLAEVPRSYASNCRSLSITYL